MMQYPFELRIGIDDDELDPEGHESSDACPDLMDEFFRQLGIQVPDHFICLSIRPVDELSKLRAGRRADNSAATMYGRQYALKPEYFDEVEIVCAGDCLKIMESAVVAFIKNNVPLTESANRFVVVRGMRPEDRAKAMWQAHLSKGHNARYAEARIYAPFNSEWFVECNGTGKSKQEEEDDFDIEF
jgi:hypothetical protein